MNKNLKFNQMMIGISTMALSFGSIQIQVSAEEKVPYNMLQMKPIGTETLKDEIAHATKADETLTFEERLKVGDFSQRPTLVMKRDESQVKQNYTLAELNKMPDSEFIDTLSRISWNQITDFFQFNQDTKAFYQNKERMNVIINELRQRGRAFTKEDSKGIETFVEILRSAFYVGYYNNELSYLKERSFHDKCLPALKAIAKNPNTIDFCLSKTRDQKAAKHFFKKALQSFHVSQPRVITVDKNPAYPIAIEQLKKEKSIPDGMQLRQQKYLNNIVEQDHRFIKKRIRSMLGLKCFDTATSILSGVEAMHMIKKEQIDLQDQSVQNQQEFIHQLFESVA